MVTDGSHVLLGHATGSPRWDIPKGLQEPGESVLAAALRELLEETGLIATPAALRLLGHLPYRPGKDVVLFVWQWLVMPLPAGLACRSTFLLRGRPVPEFDRFACPQWPAALPMLGKSMRAVLEPMAAAEGWGQTL